MTNVAVVYESMFGNTRMIAEAIAEGVRDTDPSARVEVISAGDVSPKDFDDVGLLIVGAPTHVLGLPSPRTRKSAQQASDKASDNASDNASDKASDKVSKTAASARQLEPGASGPGVREWLDTLARTSRKGQAAAFSTRLSYPLAGNAARPLARQLRRHGYAVIAKEGFIVQGGQGPLRPGELERARSWGAGLVRQPVR